MRSAIERAVRANLGCLDKSFGEPSTRNAFAQFTARQASGDDSPSAASNLPGNPVLWAAMGALAAAEAMWAFPRMFGISG